MNESEKKDKIDMKVFIEKYIASQKGGKTVDDLCSELQIDNSEYAALRNRMTKIAKKNNIVIKPLARKERSQNASAIELAGLLQEAFANSNVSK